MVKLAQRFRHLAQIDRKRIITADNVILRLNRGERPEPHPAELSEQLTFAYRESGIRQYPSYPEFYERLAAFVGQPVERLCVGAGIEEFIKTLIQIVPEFGGRFGVMPYPSCAMYDIYARAFGVDIEKARVCPHERWDAERALAWMRTPSGAAMGLLFIVNPGQPVEQHFGLIELTRIAQACHERGVILAIDEAHYGFGAVSAMPLVDYFDNVIVMRTFSKAMGAAGIRVGYTVAQPELTQALHGIRASGEISGPSMCIATVLMDSYAKYIAPVTADIASARDWAREQINKIPGLKAHGRVGFSLLIEAKGDGPIVTLQSLDSALERKLKGAPETILPSERAKQIGKCLGMQGTYVKYGFDYPLDHCLLAACGGRQMMERFVGQLQTVASVGAEAWMGSSPKTGTAA